MQALHTAATGMAAQELSVQVISNNIANLRTTGFKRQTASFQNLIYEHIRRVGAQASDQGTILPVGIDIGGGVNTPLGWILAFLVMGGGGMLGPVALWWSRRPVAASAT